MIEPKQDLKVGYDVSIVRTQLEIKEFQMRGEGMPTDKLEKIKEGLLTLHAFELMAINVYRFQITKEICELNRQLITAMCNEMTHFQDFQVKLFEYGWKPSNLRWIYWIIGFVFGYFSRLIGPNMIIRIDIWVETKAVKHYDELLRTIDWDKDTRIVVEKNQSDEYGHLNRWKSLLGRG